MKYAVPDAVSHLYVSIAPATWTGFLEQPFSLALSASDTADAVGLHMQAHKHATPAHLATNERKGTSVIGAV
ncbi:MAG: hypothetical protein ABI541_01235 [Betaproteobacteria bacterium]